MAEVQLGFCSGCLEDDCGVHGDGSIMNPTREFTITERCFIDESLSGGEILAPSGDENCCGGTDT